MSKQTVKQIVSGLEIKIRRIILFLAISFLIRFQRGMNFLIRTLKQKGLLIKKTNIHIKNKSKGQMDSELTLNPRNKQVNMRINLIHKEMKFIIEEY
jgi:hypothetical protein